MVFMFTWAVGLWFPTDWVGFGRDLGQEFGMVLGFQC
jgi:hypothetical protein